MKKNIILAICFIIAMSIRAYGAISSSAVAGQPFRTARNFDNSFDVSYCNDSFLKILEDKIKTNSHLSAEDFLTIEKEEIVGMTGYTKFIAVPEGKEAVITITQATYVSP